MRKYRIKMERLKNGGTWYTPQKRKWFFFWDGVHDEWLLKASYDTQQRAEDVINYDIGQQPEARKVTSTNYIRYPYYQEDL